MKILMIIVMTAISLSATAHLVFNSASYAPITSQITSTADSNSPTMMMLAALSIVVYMALRRLQTNL